MKYIRFEAENGAFWGVEDGEVVRALSGAPYEGGVETGKEFSLREVKRLAPCAPGKIVAVGKNYYDHAVEMREGIPENPILFLKPVTALLAPEGDIVAPADAAQIDYEGELAFVVGKKARHVKAEQAMDYIFGVTCLNDVTARDLQKKRRAVDPRQGV